MVETEPALRGVRSPGCCYTRAGCLGERSAMSTDTSSLQSDSDDVPPQWRSVEKPNGERQWIHRETGVCVDLQRFARMNQMHTPETSRVDHYEFRLVVRPDGPGTPGECVDRTTDDDHSYWMALQWLRSHRDGEVDDE